MTWTKLNHKEEQAIWQRVNDELNFTPSTLEKHFPGFREPAPSITYSLDDNFEDHYEDLHNKARQMFRACTPRDGFLYALDWHHTCYKFYPHQCNLDSSDDWIIPVWPNGDYYIFLESSLKFGWLGHPWERTICIFGGPLLHAMKSYRPNLFWGPVRQREKI